MKRLRRLFHRRPSARIRLIDQRAGQRQFATYQAAAHAAAGKASS